MASVIERTLRSAGGTVGERHGASGGPGSAGTAAGTGAEAPETPSPAPTVPADLERKVTRAEQLLKAGARKRAQKLVDEILAQVPDEPRALLVGAQIALDRGDLDAAFASAKRAAAVDPNLADAHLTLGVVYEQRGDVPAAVAAYRRYLELAPDGRYADSIRRTLDRLEGSR